MENSEFNIRLEFSLIYYKYKYNVNKAHIILFKNFNDDKYIVELADVDLNSEIRYEEYVERVVDAYENKLDDNIRSKV